MTPTLHHFASQTIDPVPWKNGGGTTREIARWPVAASLTDFDWRVSIAEIAHSGPFSVFTGIDRVIVLLDGDGVHLRGPGIDHRLDQLYTPFPFCGDVPLQCTLLGGTCHDLNVMSRRGRCEATIQIINQSVELIAGRQGLLFCFSGAWRFDHVQFRSGEGIWWHAPPSDSKLDAEADSALALSIQWNAPRPVGIVV